MNSRIEFLKSELFKEKRKISLERALIFTESYKTTEGEPEIIRRAKAVKSVLEKVKISIREKEILVGNRTIAPRSGIISPEMDPYWILEELDTLPTRPQDKFEVTEEDKEIYKTVLFNYWKGKSLKDNINKELSPEIMNPVKMKIVKLNQTDKGQGHIIPDFETILNRGFGDIRDEVKSCLDKNSNNDFYRASLISLEASINHILRYKVLAEEMKNKEKDETRKNELDRIAKAAEKLSIGKPETFYEACQLLWYVSIILQYESNASSLSLGRLDQYLYKFYDNDFKKGIEREELKETLEAFYIKTNDVVLIRSEDSAKFFAGFPTGYTMLLGGMDEKGHSSINDLSYLCLEAYQDIRLPQPNIGVRVNEFIDREFLVKTAETIRLGTGIPQIFNDEAVIPSFLNRNITLEDARDYSVVGCVELSIPGKTYGLHDIAMFNLLKVMELVLKRNKDNSNISYEQIIKEIKEDIEKYVKVMVEGSNIVDIGHKNYAAVPLLSTFIDGCLIKGKDITEGGAKYNFSGVQGIGIANLSDSLYVIKKMVFEEKRYTFKELIEMLDNNFETEEGEKFRQKLINKYDKYGNDNEEVDLISSDILRHYCKVVERYETPRGGTFIPGSYTVSAHVPLGEGVGATPDGRKAKEQLADGGLSPMVGVDRLGPTAVLKSVSKLDNFLLSNGSLLNVKFSPGVLEGDAGLNKLADYITAFMRLKLQHIQFNIINAETLKEAQKNPEKYSGLVVRVAGYSAFFTELSKEIQNDIINRTEHKI